MARSAGVSLSFSVLGGEGFLSSFHTLSSNFYSSYFFFLKIWGLLIFESSWTFSGSRYVTGAGTTFSTFFWDWYFLAPFGWVKVACYSLLSLLEIMPLSISPRITYRLLTKSWDTLPAFLAFSTLFLLYSWISSQLFLQFTVLLYTFLICSLIC